MNSSLSKRRVSLLIVLALLAALVVWIARNTYWEEVPVPVPVPLRGQALFNPYYAAQRFAQSLGAHAEKVVVLSEMPGPRDVLVLGSWHWDLLASRRQRIEHWVEAGGRLVVDRTLIGSVGNFSRWSGIDRLESDEFDLAETDEEAPLPEEEECRLLEPMHLRLCGYEDGSKLVPMRAASWSLNDRTGVQVARVAVGRGSVTVINGDPFYFREFLEGDHPRLFVAATQLSRGDRVLFLSEQDHPNLLMLLWIYAAPALCLGLGWIVLAIWRNGASLGPPIPPPETTRRSLGEQIRGTGQFVLRFGNGMALQRAQVRALDEAARRRIPGYAALPEGERAREVARLANIEADALLAAIGLTGKLRPAQLRNAIELLETARRRLLENSKGS